MLDRRRFLLDGTAGFGGLALTLMLHREMHAEAGSDGALLALHHPPRAKRVVQLFMAGAASHIDLWDYKPQLAKVLI